MTDAHRHVARGEGRHFLCSPRDPASPVGPLDRVFVGFHPWQFLPSSTGPVPTTTGPTSTGPVPTSSPHLLWGHSPQNRGLSLENGGLSPDIQCLSPENRIECQGQPPCVKSRENTISPHGLNNLREILASGAAHGIGEIGLDRLKCRTIPQAMREAFTAQLRIAAEFARPVVLHGAKCWGEVVRECRKFAGTVPNSAGTVPAFIFHGFSRSEGLIPEIIAIGGYISVGPALLNDHAVNYRRMAKALPDEILLVESDATANSLGTVPKNAGTGPNGAGTGPENLGTGPTVVDVAECLARLRGVPLDVLVARLESNADRIAGL